MESKSVFGIALLIAALSCFGEVAITIYNQGFGLVKQSRNIDIGTGIQDFDFSPVPSGIRPQTVHLKADCLFVLEQNYEYDLVGTKRLLEKNIDNQIRILTQEGDVYEGTLLSSDGSSVLIETKQGLTAVLLDGVLDLTFPKRPNRFYTRPTLAWKLHSEKSGKRDMEISYMTDGIVWEAAYVASVDEKDEHLTLDGWVTISNKSGMTYEDATLKLVAGDVHTAEQPPPYPTRTKDGMMALESAPRGFEEESFFEYHLYTLPRKATVADRQDKQISLFDPAETTVEKELVFDGSRGSDVRVELVFENSKEKGPGMPLPKGVIRVYKEDKSGALQFVGEDRIDHTPKDEDVRIYLGNAFDIKAERTQTDYRRISDRVSERDFKIELRNHKDENVEIIVRERFWGDWFIKTESHEGVKKDARTNEWTIPVPKEGLATLSFTVRNK
ncbi:MAG TPA: DUF4139 domain-containing protein [candidate division Zixibacteria bacterium]|nr:DUF4139 domain-containing protein [candidate division Zixibacteria bacterium]